MLPDLGRGHGVIGRQILGSLAGGDDLETTGAGPINQLASQRRLVAVGQGIDDAPRPRLLGEQWSGQHIGFDIDHDDVLAGRDRRARMGNARRRTAGRLDNDLNPGIRAGLDARCDERGSCDPGRIPADAPACVTGPLRIEIGNDRDLHARHRRRLVQEHRAELAGADQRDPHRSPVGGALLRQAVKAHGPTSYSAATL